jgi:hypothetical protein
VECEERVDVAAEVAHGGQEQDVIAAVMALFYYVLSTADGIHLQ